MTRDLRMYLVHDGYPVEGCVLVFAHSHKQARVLGWKAIQPWNDEARWTDVRAYWLREPKHSYLRASARSAEPHAIDDPPSCSHCELWGTGEILDGECAECREAAAGALEATA